MNQIGGVNTQEDEGSSRKAEGLCRSKEETDQVQGWRGLTEDFCNEWSDKIGS